MTQALQTGINAGPWLTIPDDLPVAGILDIPCDVRIIAADDDTQGDGIRLSGNGPGELRQQIIALLQSNGYTLVKERVSNRDDGPWSIRVTVDDELDHDPGWLVVHGGVRVEGTAQPNFHVEATGDIQMGHDVVWTMSIRSHGSVILGRNAEVKGTIRCIGELRMRPHAQVHDDVKCGRISLRPGAAILSRVNVEPTAATLVVAPQADQESPEMVFDPDAPASETQGLEESATDVEPTRSEDDVSHPVAFPTTEHTTPIPPASSEGGKHRLMVHVGGGRPAGQDAFMVVMADGGPATLLERIADGLNAEEAVIHSSLAALRPQSPPDTSDMPNAQRILVHVGGGASIGKDEFMVLMAEGGPQAVLGRIAATIPDEEIVQASR